MGALGFSDADWAGCQRTRRSTLGGTILLGDHLLKAWSRTQATFALSSAESELCSSLLITEKESIFGQAKKLVVCSTLFNTAFLSGEEFCVKASMIDNPSKKRGNAFNIDGRVVVSFSK